MNSINIQNIYKKFYFCAVKTFLLACLILIFTHTFSYASATTYSANDYYATDEEAYRIEQVKDGVSYYYKFYVDALDLQGNDTHIQYGILLKKADGSDTTSVTNVITSYTDKNFIITTTEPFNGYAYNFTSNGITYYVTQTDGAGLEPTVTSSAYIGQIANNTIGNALKNTTSIDSIIADFIGNNTTSSGSTNNIIGGALYNTSTINILIGNFVDNYTVVSGATASNLHGGGAIHNTGSMVLVSGDFIGNGVASGSGGAILNRGTINSIVGDFLSNYASGSSAYVYYNGGAISNIGGTINSIYGNFIENSFSSSGGLVSAGGAIYNNGTIGSIKGDFLLNSMIGTGYGGAIGNYGATANTSITSIEANFIGNKATSGGAIFNSVSSIVYEASIGTISGNFIENSATSGGAIDNLSNASIDKIIGDFVANSASLAGAIRNFANTAGGEVNIGSITGNFVNNTSTGIAGAIYNGAENTSQGDAYIGSITAPFIKNEASDGGAIYNSYNGTIGEINGSFYQNIASTGSGGAIYNDNSSIGNITGDFSYNSSGGSGGAIYNTGTSSSIGTIIGSFIGNSAGTSGGAIYTNSALNFLAANKNITFSNNYTGSGSSKDYNAIDTTANLTFAMTGTGSYTINDSILTNNNNITFTGQSVSKNNIYLNDIIDTNNTISITNATLHLGSFLHDDNTTVTSALDMDSGTIAIGDNSIFRINAKDYTSSAQTTDYAGSILYGVTITGDTNSQWIVENIANGSYDYGDGYNTDNWAGTYATGNSLQSIEMYEHYFSIEKVVNSVLYEGPMGDIISEAAGKNEFGSLANSLLGTYIANTTDFIYGGTNWLVGTEKQQAAFIEGSAKISSVIGVNANTLHINRAGYEAISLRRLDANKRERSILEEKAYTSKINSENIVIYDANGRVKEEYRNEYQLQDTSAFKRVIEENNLTAWLAPMYHYEDVHGMASDAYFAGYNSNIYGAKMGIDLTTQDPRSRSGLAFGAGKGTSISTGDFKDIENDYYFISLSAYESFNISNWVLNANVGYTRMQNSIMHDISKFEMDNLYADVDSFIWNLAFSAEHEKSYKNILFSPHIGLELAYLRSNDYEVKMGKNLGTIYYVGTNAQQLALIPLGVKIEKEFSLGTWSLLPELDLNFMTSLGEIDEEFYITAPGFIADATLTGKVLDRFTYGADLSLLINKENLGFGLNYSFDYSKNRMAHSAALQVKFDF